MAALKVFIGWDSREEIAYEVCRQSLEANSSIPLEITPIKQADLRRRGLYTRDSDPLSSTEFSFTRFLVPHLADYRGWAVFVDCDFLFRRDIAGLLDYRDSSKAIYCVKHDYRPNESTKMDGQPQTQYARKNWSSFMLINCAHEQVKQLTPAVVNAETGLFLNRFQWLTDDVIGSLPVTWNYLEGWHTKADCADPIAVHYTRGGPWFDNWRHVEFGAEWTAEANRYGHKINLDNEHTLITHAKGPTASPKVSHT
jgi:lipopolysaccharide biosynthesis glycosyltransferase